MSTGLSASASGLPVVCVLSLYNGAPWVLVTTQDINKPQDLAGKTLAVSGARTAPHSSALAGLKNMKISERDVGFIATGGTASSFAALVSNQVAGAVLTPPFDDKAVTLGFKKFLFLGDLVDIPYVGLITSQAEVKTNRDRVRKTVAALLQAVSWLRTHREESAKMIAEKFKITHLEAGRTHDTMISMFTKDGRLNPKTARGYMDILRSERSFSPDLDPTKFVDFSMLPGQ